MCHGFVLSLPAMFRIRNERAVENGFLGSDQLHRVFSACVKASSLQLMSRAGVSGAIYQEARELTDILITLSSKIII